MLRRDMMVSITGLVLFSEVCVWDVLGVDESCDVIANVNAKANAANATSRIINLFIVIYFKGFLPTNITNFILSLHCQ